MASPSPVASRTRAGTKKEEPFAGSFSGAKPGRREGGPLGVKRAAGDVLFLGFGTAGVGTESGGRGDGQRLSSVSGGLGGGSTSDDSREVIVITGSEDDSDEVISVNGSGEDEEVENAVIVDEKERTNFESDESEGGHENEIFGGDDFLSGACCDDDLIRFGQERVFAKQGEGSCRSSKSKNGDYTRNVSGKRTPSITEDGPQAHLSFDYVSSSSESSTESDDSSDKDFVVKVSESLSADGETSLSSEEYVSTSEHEENLEIRKKRKCEGLSTEEYVSTSEHEENLEIRKKRKWEGRGESHSLESSTKTTREDDIECTNDRLIDFARKKEDVECRLWVNEWLQDDVVEEKAEEATNVELDIECMDDLVIDDAGRKENVECRASWDNEWLQGDVVELKEEKMMNVEQLNAEINCPPSDNNGNSGQMEARGIFSVLERGGVREKGETDCTSQEGGEGLQVGDDEHGDEGKAGVEFDGVNARTDVSFVDGGGEIEEMEVVRITQEKRCDKHVQLDSDSAVDYATSLKEVGQKKRDSSMSCGMRQQKEKRKYEDCSSEKAFARRNAEREQESATDGAVKARRRVISKPGEHTTCLGSSAEPMMQLRKASETLSKLCKEADTIAAKEKKKGSSVGRCCQSNEKAVRSDGKDNGESRTRRERAGESRADTLYKLTSCIWGKNEILEDAVHNENAEKEKPLAGHCAKKEERKESTEGLANFGMTANSIKKDCLDEMYENKKVEEWRKDCRSTRDYHIRWERSRRSKEFKYFKRLSQKYNENDAGWEEIVWELPRRTEPQPEGPPLPLKFFWGDKEPEPAPKSEAEKEMDKMWSDMEFSLRAGEFDSSEPPVSLVTRASNLKAHQR